MFITLKYVVVIKAMNNTYMVFDLGFRVKTGVAVGIMISFAETLKKNCYG